MLVISLMLPFMQPVILLIGAVPMSLITVIYPIAIYYFTFERLSLCMKIVLTTITVTTVIFMLGAAYVSLKVIVGKIH